MMTHLQRLESGMTTVGTGLGVIALTVVGAVWIAIWSTILCAWMNRELQYRPWTRKLFVVVVSPIIWFLIASYAIG